MLLTMMFHRVTESANDDTQAFADYLKKLKQSYSIVIPREKLKSGANLCLTFDDAYVDFYAVVFPLLKELQIKAVLAVPAGMIEDDTSVDMATRLNIPQTDAMQTENLKQASLCTWKELKEMQQSGLVQIASHSMGHLSMNDPACDLTTELADSKQLIESKLQCSVDTLIYPYGHFQKTAHLVAQKHYQTIFRVGYAMNTGWAKPGAVLYRINADHFWPNNRLPSAWNRLSYLAKCASNRLRSK